MELNLIDGNPINDITKVKIPKYKDGYDLIPALDIIESCSEKAQQIANDIFLLMSKGTYQMIIRKSDATTELIEKKILCEYDDNSLKNKLLNRKMLVEFLKEN